MRDPADTAHLWTLSRRGHEITATARLTPRGLEIRLDWDGQPYCSRLFVDEDGLLAWANERCGTLEAEGWVAQKLAPWA